MRLIDADALDYTTIQTDDYSGNEIYDVVLKEDIDNAPTVDIQTAIWELYKRYQPRLATNVYEFGVELRAMLDRYGYGGRG